MSLLRKKSIQSVEDIQYEIVNVPEWGGDVRVKGLSGRERDIYIKGLVKGKGDQAHADLTNMTAKLVALCMVDEKGERMFNNMEVAELSQKSAKALTRVYKVAMRLSGLDEAEQDEILKNSADSPSADFGTN